MNIKKKIKEQIDGFSEVELEKVHLYLASMKKPNKINTIIGSFSLKGKLDKKDIRSVVYE